MSNVTGTFKVGKYVSPDKTEKTFVIFEYTTRDKTYYTRANFKEGEDEDSLEVALGKICSRIAEELRHED